MKRITQGHQRSGRGRVAAWLAGVGFAAAVAVPACTTSTTATTKGCSLNSDCATDLICALGRCRPHCVNASDCPIAGSSCIDDEAET